MHLHSVSRLIILLCIGSVICESRESQKLRPEVHQPFDYRCPCVPADSCPHSTTLLVSPCPDVETVRCCANITSRNARIYLGVEPLTSAITMSEGLNPSKQEATDMAQEMESLNIDKYLEEEIKVDFKIDKLNNRNMKAINLSSDVNNINVIIKDVNDKLNDENETVLESKNETETELNIDHIMIDVDEMLKNSSILDSVITSNIHKLYETNNGSDDGSKVKNITTNITEIHENDEQEIKKASIPHVKVSKYQIVYPMRVRDESKKKIIVYPSVDNIETDKDKNDTNSEGNDVDFSDSTEKSTLNEDDYVQETTSKEDDDTKDSAKEENVELDDLETSSNEEIEELMEVEAKETDEEASSSEILEHLIEFGRKMNISSDEKELVPLMDEEIKMATEIEDKNITKTTHLPTLKVTNINVTLENPNEMEEENEDLESAPISAASEVVEQIVMPDEPNENMEVESMPQAKIPIRLPSRNLKLQIQGGNRPQTRHTQPKRDKPQINKNHSNIRDIINSKNYGPKVDLPKPGKNRNFTINPRLKQQVVSKTMTPSPSFNLNPNSNEEQEVAETKSVPRGVFVPPDNIERGFLPMVGQPDLKIVGPIPRGFQDRSKPNDFQTEDGIRISELNLPSEKEPPLFFSVFQQGRSNTDNAETLEIISESEDNEHPELPEEEAKDFLSPPNTEVYNKSLYETTEDGVYIVQLPLPSEGKVESFRSEEEDTEIEETGPSDHFNVDIELESKEDQITPFQLQKNKNQFNFNRLSQSSGQNINFQPSQQDFQNNFDGNSNINSNFLNNQEANTFQTEFENDPILTSLQLPKSVQTNFLGSQNFEFSPSPLKENTHFPILNFDSTKDAQDVSTFQLPVEEEPENFRTNFNDDDSFSAIQKRPQHTLAFFPKSPGDAAFQQGFPVTQRLPENRTVKFAPVLNNDASFRHVSLSQELPSTNTVNFLPKQTNPFNSDAPLEKFNSNKQPSQNKPFTFISQQNSPQSLPQSPRNRPFRFNEGAFQRPHVSLIQQLPKTEIINFAGEREHANDNTVFKQQLPSTKETQFLNPQNNKETFPQRTVLKYIPLQNNFKFQRTPLTKVPAQRNPQFEFQNAQKDKQPFRLNGEVNVRPNFNRLASAQIQLPGKNLVVIRPSESPPTALNPSDNEKTKYDIALEKYKADIKAYQEQYEAFLRKNFPSAIRIF